MITQAYILLSLAISVLTLASNSTDSILKQEAINKANFAIIYAQTIINEKSVPVNLLDSRPGWKIYNPENIEYPSCVTDDKDIVCGG